MVLWKRLLTTGAGAAVAFTLFIGPAPLTTADPGSRGPNSGQSSSRDDARGRGADSPRGRGSSNDPRGKVPAPKSSVPTRDAPSSDVGKGELPPTEWVDAGPSLTGTSTQPNLRSAGTETAVRADAPAAAETERPTVITPEGARTVRTPRSARGTATGAGGSGRPSVPVPTAPGPEVSPEPAAPERPVADTAREPISAQPTSDQSAAVPAAMPQPVPGPLSPWRISVPRVAEPALPTAPLVADRRPGQPMTSLFGLLGLLLIPVAGAALGYRQARAARSAGVQPHV